MTKSTPDIPILDDGAVREIEAHLKRWDRGEVSKQTFPVNWKNAAALCQTVRVLRAEIAKLTTQWCQCGHTKDQHSFFSDHDECYECDQASSDLCCEWRPLARPEQLQSQLEQLGADVLVKARNDTVKYLESQLEQLRAENEKLKASRRVHELDNHHNALACGYCAGPIKDEITQLQSQLEQVTKERDDARTENERLASQLKQWQEEQDTKAGYM